MQEQTPSFIDLNIINEPIQTTHDSSIWTAAIGSTSSLTTNNTTFDDTLMRSLIVSFCISTYFFFFDNVANSTSAYEIISYANNIKSTLKRTISCESNDDESFATSINDLYLTDENISVGKLQITINYNA